MFLGGFSAGLLQFTPFHLAVEPTKRNTYSAREVERGSQICLGLHSVAISAVEAAGEASFVYAGHFFTSMKTECAFNNLHICS